MRGGLTGVGCCSRRRLLSVFYPTGKSSDKRAKPFSHVQPLPKKYSGFPKSQITGIIRTSCPTEGRFAIVTDAGWDAVDVEAPITNGAEADGEVVWS